MGFDPAAVTAAKPLITMPPAGARDARPGLSGVPVDALESWLSQRDQPAYRAKQLADHIWSGAAQSSPELHTLPQTLRNELCAEYRVSTLLDTDISPADDGLTVGTVHPWQTLELLWELRRGNFEGTIYFDTFPDRVDPAAETAANVDAILRFERMLDRIDPAQLRDVQARQDAIAAVRMLHGLMGE